MLEISKEFLRGDPNRTGDTDAEATMLSNQTTPRLSADMWTCESARPKQRPGSAGSVRRDGALGTKGFEIHYTGRDAVGRDGSFPSSNGQEGSLGAMRSDGMHNAGREAVPGMRLSRSAGSLHSRTQALALSPGSDAGNTLRPHVLKNAGFSWPGRHLGPDEEG